jgi:hypothetical protein
MTSHMRRRFWVELLTGAAAALVAILTVAVPAWLERLLGLDLDRGNGALEWAIACALFFVSLTSTALARREWVVLRARASGPRPGCQSPG